MTQCHNGIMTLLRKMKGLLQKQQDYFYCHSVKHEPFNPNEKK